MNVSRWLTAGTLNYFTLQPATVWAMGLSSSQGTSSLVLRWAPHSQTSGLGLLHGGYICLREMAKTRRKIRVTPVKLVSEVGKMESFEIRSSNSTLHLPLQHPLWTKCQWNSGDIISSMLLPVFFLLLLSLVSLLGLGILTSGWLKPRAVLQIFWIHWILTPTKKEFSFKTKFWRVRVPTSSLSIHR